MVNLLQAERSPIQKVSESYQAFAAGKTFLAGGNLAQVQQCGLVDLTNLSRVGFRGTDSAQYLKDAGFELPDLPNTCVVQADGSNVVRLSLTEYLLLGSFKDFGESILALENNWQYDNSFNYLLPRQDSHAWFQITGESIVQIMAKLCGVDLSFEQFAVGQVAQTSVARINAIMMNVSDAQAPKFNILCDRAAALYLWGVLLDAMTEFEGKVIGISTLTEH